MNLFIFSVSTTLKSYLIIIAYKFLNVNNIVLLNYKHPKNPHIVLFLHFTKLNISSISSLYGMLYCLIVVFLISAANILQVQWGVCSRQDFFRLYKHFHH